MKKLLLIAFAIFTFNVHALPQFAMTKYYFTDSSKTEIAGIFTSGCMMRSVHMTGVTTPYYTVDPVKYDCGRLGYAGYTSKYSKCFSPKSAWYEPEYTDPKSCVEDQWGSFPFDFM